MILDVQPRPWDFFIRGMSQFCFFHKKKNSSWERPYAPKNWGKTQTKKKVPRLLSIVARIHCGLTSQSQTIEKPKKKHESYHDRGSIFFWHLFFSEWREPLNKKSWEIDHFILAWFSSCTYLGHGWEFSSGIIYSTFYFFYPKPVLGRGLFELSNWGVVLEKRWCTSDVARVEGAGGSIAREEVPNPCQKKRVSWKKRDLLTV